jgi:NAD(P)-dependent dehydrogenase (short-subunit alcohol dehydrogenase family)
MPVSIIPANVKWLSGIDLTVEASLEGLAKAVSEEFSEPFSVIHCVGNFWVHRPLVETSFSEIVAMVNSHVVTLFGAARYLTPLMIKSGGGRIVAFSCNSVVYSYPDMSPFTASKAALESFIRCHANEYAEFGITSCALALPTIRTAAVLDEKPTGDHKNYITPDELANTIVSDVLAQSHIISGNVIKLFKHSPTFYNSSYYQRNPRRPTSTL